MESTQQRPLEAVEGLMEVLWVGGGGMEEVGGTGRQSAQPAHRLLPPHLALERGLREPFTERHQACSWAWLHLHLEQAILSPAVRPCVSFLLCQGHPEGCLPAAPRKSFRAETHRQQMRFEARSILICARPTEMRGQALSHHGQSSSPNPAAWHMGGHTQGDPAHFPTFCPNLSPAWASISDEVFLLWDRENFEGVYSGDHVTFVR